MPNVKGTKKSGARSGNKSLETADKRPVLNQRARPAKARDDLSGDFSGNENRGPAANQKENHRTSTHLRDRNIAIEGLDKEPVR